MNYNKLHKQILDKRNIYQLMNKEIPTVLYLSEPVLNIINKEVAALEQMLTPEAYERVSGLSEYMGMEVIPVISSDIYIEVGTQTKTMKDFIEEEGN